MENKEFLSIVSGEIEKLEQELQNASARVEFLEKLNSSDEELQKAKYQLELVKAKIDSVSGYVVAPAYARIAAASDIEIEEYKKSKIAKLELEIQKIESKKQQEKEKLVQLKAEAEQLEVQYASLNGTERDDVIRRAQELYAKIKKYSEEEIFTKLEQKIAEIRKKQEEIKSMSSERVKVSLYPRGFSSPEYYYNSQADGWNREYREESLAANEILASVASDPEKEQQIYNLISAYNKITEEQEEQMATIKIDKVYYRRLPESLKKKIGESWCEHWTSWNDTMKVIDNYQYYFKWHTSFVLKEATEENLTKLADERYLGPGGLEYDLDFIKKHKGHYVSNNYSYRVPNPVPFVFYEDLIRLIEYKKSAKKSELQELNVKIQELQRMYREQIIQFYEYCRTFYASGTRPTEEETLPGFRFNSLDDLKRSIKEFEEYVHDVEISIDNCKMAIQKAQTEVEQIRQSYEPQKNEIVQQMIAIGGEKFKEFPTYAKYYTSIRHRDFTSANAFVFQKEIMDKVQQEAQNQAYLAETEIGKGITVEQLLQMEQQGMIDESINQGIEESSPKR